MPRRLLNPLPKPRITRGKEYRWWIASVTIGGITLRGFGDTPVAAYSKLLIDARGSNRVGGSIWNP